MRLIDLTGQTFGELTVQGRAENRQGAEARWHCTCSCGGSTTTTSSNLRRGQTVSCGCARARFNRKARTTHGACRTTEYEIWSSIIKRCENPNYHAYPNYGGRGITICPEWRADFAVFLRDVGYRPSKELSIDRIDNNGNYEPGNVRWATAKEQVANRRTPEQIARDRAEFAARES
ncbi:hypothetical protein OG216_09905 [Streptomycetaceae bacterium NBC_01309]